MSDRSKSDGIFQWLYRELQWAKERNAVLVRVEMSPEQWRTLQREVPMYEATPINPDRNKVFGLDVRIVPGKKAPEVVAADG